MSFLKSMQAHHTLISGYDNPLQDNLERIEGHPLPAFDLDRIHPALLGTGYKLKDRNTYVRERLTDMGGAAWKHEDPVSLRLDTRLALLGDPHVQDYRAFNVPTRFEPNTSYMTQLGLKRLAKRFATRPAASSDFSVKANELVYFRIPDFFQSNVASSFQGTPSPLKELLIGVEPNSNPLQRRVFIGDVESKSLQEWTITPAAEADELEQLEGWKNRFDQKNAWWNLVHTLLPELSLKLFFDNDQSPKIGWLAAAAPMFGVEELTAYNAHHRGVLSNTLLHIMIAQALGPGSWRQGWSFTPIEKIDAPNDIENWNIRGAKIAEEHKLSQEENEKLIHSGFFEVPTHPGLMSSLFSTRYHHAIQKQNQMEAEATLGIPSSILFGTLAHLKHQQTHHNIKTHQTWNKLRDPNSDIIAGLALDGQLLPTTIMASECVLMDCFSPTDLMSRFGIYWPSNPYEIDSVLGTDKSQNAKSSSYRDLIKALQVRLMGGYQ